MVKLLRILLIFVPLAVIARLIGLGPTAIFVLSFLGIIPLANLLGEATEVLAKFTGPKIGGLLNATLGTLTEIIILFALLRSGQIEILKASIIGGILMSLLVAVGLALFLGGIRNGTQHFDQKSVGLGAVTMMLAVIGLLLPTLFGLGEQFNARNGFSATFQDRATDTLSVLVALILFGLYLLTVVYQLRAPEGQELSETQSAEETPAWSLRTAIGILIAATLAIAAMGELLSGAIEPFGESLNLTPMFMGVILLPIAGGFSEILVSIRMARRNEVNLGISIPLNGAMQGALFVAPLLVFLSLIFLPPLSLYFGLGELLAAGLAVSVAAYIAIDGVTSWLEGAQLLALWAMLALWFFFSKPLT